MAQSPSHKFGQIIGELLEEMVRAPLTKVAKKRKLYLDYKHARPTRGNRRKVVWTDNKNNDHELDYVLEYGGTEKVRGVPKAFIESAWRRYTKHSRNKAQEIQGAVSTLAETYRDNSPFIGVVLAGVFTAGSLAQLRSHGFNIVYCSYQTVMEAFASVGIDAAFDEDTSDVELQKKVDAFGALDSRRRRKLLRELRKRVQSDLDTFIEQLEVSLTRQIERILIATLHGFKCDAGSVKEAIELIRDYDEGQAADSFVRYEIAVRYTNGDRIMGQFEEKNAAIEFLNRVI